VVSEEKGIEGPTKSRGNLALGILRIVENSRRRLGRRLNDTSGLGRATSGPAKLLWDVGRGLLV
jgi:hypothetical protein